MSVTALNQSFPKIKTIELSLDSFAQCVPNTWLYESAKGAALIGLRRCHEAISVLEQAKQHIPEGYYVDYLNQSLAYMRVNDRPSVLRIYQQLSAKPETVLVKEPKVLRLLTLLGLMLEQPDQAEKFYRLYHQYYSNNVKFEASGGA